MKIIRTYFNNYNNSNFYLNNFVLLTFCLYFLNYNGTSFYISLQILSYDKVKKFILLCKKSFKQCFAR